MKLPFPAALALAAAALAATTTVVPTTSAQGALMTYTTNGAFIGIELVSDCAGVNRLAGARAALIEHARPLNVFLATRSRARA